MIHNCKEWLEEGQGCSICNRIGLISFKELKNVQEHINWKISTVTKENKNIKNENRKLRIQIRNLQGQINKFINKNDD